MTATWRRNHVEKTFNLINLKLSKTDAKGMIVFSFPRIFFEFLLLLSALSILFAFMLVDLEKTTMVSNLTIFSLCAYRLFPAFSRIHVFYQLIRFRYNSLEKIYDFIVFSEKESEIINKPSFEKIESDTLIQLKNLDFSFENKKNDNKKLFQNLNLKIKKTEKIAIIGESGSGKSTLLELILSLIEPTSGNKIFNNLHYENIDNFSSKTGYVYQEQIIFDSNLASNISLEFEKEEVQYDKETLEKLYKSIDNSLVSEFITNSDIFNFQLSENGSNISAGQRQRIFIARALFKAKELLVFDEPTSNLDPNTENRVLENIFKNYEELAIVMCTHRYSNINKFDHVLSINKGQLVKANV